MLCLPFYKELHQIIVRNFALQQDNDQKHIANATKKFIRGKKWKVVDWPSQSPGLNPIDKAFHSLKRRLKGETPPKQTETESS